MASDKTVQWLQNRREDIREADYPQKTKDAILTFLDAYNPDCFQIQPPIKQGKDTREKTLATSSRLAYASTLHNTAQYFDLIECTARELNRHANQRLNGRHESVDADGISQNTVHQNQVAWRSFAQFHHNHPEGMDIQLDPASIVLVDRDDPSVDERDIYDPEDVEAMRKACQTVRDRCLLEMLIYTGQRHNCLRQLKFEDVRPDQGESGILYIPDTQGMKGSEGKRPLLGAQKHARKWRDAHPTQEPEDAFFTHIYDWSGHDDIEPGDHLSRQSFGRIPKRIAERAGVMKPTNPHQWRHYFATMAISKHGMSMDTVRHLLGHAPDSRELERTYQHLVDDDHIENAELTMDIRDGREESLTPPQCHTCNEPLEPSWSVCPECERVYGPDAEKVKDEISETATQGALEATDEREQQDIERLLDILEDPTVVNQLVALSNSLDGDEELTDVFG